MRDIEPDCVTPIQGMILKDKNCNVKCMYAYLDGRKVECDSSLRNEEISAKHICAAPEQWQVVKWLRKAHNINVEANYLPPLSKTFGIIFLIIQSFDI